MTTLTIVGGRGHLARPRGEPGTRTQITRVLSTTPCDHCGEIAHTADFVVEESNGARYVFCSSEHRTTYRDNHGKAIHPNWRHTF